MIEADVVSDAVIPTPEQLADRYAGDVHRFAAMICRDRSQSDDLAQEAMVKAMRSLHRFDPHRASIKAWLWRIVVNVARDAHRAATRAEALCERFARGETRAGDEDTESIVLRRIDDDGRVAGKGVDGRRDVFWGAFYQPGRPGTYRIVATYDGQVFESQFAVH